MSDVHLVEHDEQTVMSPAEALRAVVFQRVAVRRQREDLDRVLSVACLSEKDRAGVRATERMREVLDLGGPRWAWGKR